MREVRRFLVLVPALVFALTLAVHAQDEPSLGDVARQARQQKQQKDSEAQPVVVSPQNGDGQNGNPQDNAAPSSGPQSGATHGKDTPNKDAQSQDAQTAKDAAKDAAPKPSAPKTPHVITNEDIASPYGPYSESQGTHASGTKSPSEGGQNGNASAENKASAETWRTQIEAQKNAITALEGQISTLSDSILYAPGNCVSGCVEWNERQKQKQDQVEAMKAQLGQLQQHLEEMQEAARQQGYGSAVYEP